MERNRSKDFPKSRKSLKTIMRKALTVNSSVFCMYLCQSGESPRIIILQFNLQVDVCSAQGGFLGEREE